MTSKSLLTLIHFTLLFIIGLLFTIFLSKIKNAIFIEKFGIFGRGGLFDKLDLGVEPVWIPTPDFDLGLPTDWDEVFDAISGQGTQPGQDKLKKPCVQPDDFRALYNDIICGGVAWDKALTSTKGKNMAWGGGVQGRAKSDFGKLSNKDKIIMVYKFYKKYKDKYKGYYPTKDFRDKGSPYKDSDGNIRYILSDIWNNNDWGNDVFGPWPLNWRDDRNGDNMRAYLIYMGLYEGLAEFLSEFDGTTQDNAQYAIELAVAFELFFDKLAAAFKIFFDDDQNLENLVNKSVRIITTTSANGNKQTRFNWRPVMFKILKETTEDNKETLLKSVKSSSTEWENNIWAEAVFRHLKGWTSIPHEIVDTIKIKDYTKKDDIYLIDNNSIVVVLTTTKPDLEYHHQINNIFENRYKLEIEGEEDKIFDNEIFDNKIFKYTFPDDLKNGKYKLKISVVNNAVVNNAGNSEAKSIDILKKTPVDCKGITLPCSTACETGSNRFIVTREPTGTGSPCPVISDCRTGSGLCGSTVGPNVLGVKTKAELEAVKKFEYPWIGSLMTWDEKIGSKIGSELETKLKKHRDIKINLNDNSNLCEDGSGVHELGGSWQYKCDSTGSTGSLIKISNFKNKINGIFSYSTVN
tara:strand:+ start:2075 stop:3973 length:1899 start_codon:yes stop_codon:yes gene_type:complete